MVRNKVRKELPTKTFLGNKKFKELKRNTVLCHFRKLT